MAHLLKLIVRSVQLYFIESSGPVFVFALFNFQDPTRLSFARRLARIPSFLKLVNSYFQLFANFPDLHCFAASDIIFSDLSGADPLVNFTGCQFGFA